MRARARARFHSDRKADKLSSTNDDTVFCAPEDLLVRNRRGGRTMATERNQFAICWRGTRSKVHRVTCRSRPGRRRAREMKGVSRDGVPQIWEKRSKDAFVRVIARGEMLNYISYRWITNTGYGFVYSTFIPYGIHSDHAPSYL